MKQRLANHGARFEYHDEISQGAAESEIDKVQSFEVPSDTPLDLLLEMVLPDTEARNVLASFRRYHGVDLWDKAKADTVWIILFFAEAYILERATLTLKWTEVSHSMWITLI